MGFPLLGIQFSYPFSRIALTWPPYPHPQPSSSVSRQSLNPKRFLKGYILEAIHSVHSTCWSLHRLPRPLNRETNCGETAFQHTGWAVPCGVYYQKAFKSAVEPLLNISQWIKYHFSPHSCSMWVTMECIFFFSGRGRLLYKPKHWGNEIICVRIL